MRRVVTCEIDFFSSFVDWKNVSLWMHRVSTQNYEHLLTCLLCITCRRELQQQQQRRMLRSAFHVTQKLVLDQFLLRWNWMVITKEKQTKYSINIKWTTPPTIIPFSFQQTFLHTTSTVELQKEKSLWVQSILSRNCSASALWWWLCVRSDTQHKEQWRELCKLVISRFLWSGQIFIWIHCLVTEWW